MNTTYELNNLRKDSDIPGRINKQSPIVEVFSAMVNGEELSKFGAKADKAVSYIKELGSRADAGDFTAVAELNSLRRFVVEAPIMQELKLLNIFGSYQHVGFDETVEREVWDYAGEPSRIQAAGGNSPIATWSRGGLTSFTGNNVRTGRVETRFDIELAVDVAQGREYQVGTLYDTSIGGLSV